MLKESGDGKRLPLTYRVLLKLPVPRVPEFFYNLPWIIIVRLSIFFYVFVAMTLLLAFPFPANIILAVSGPAIITVFLARIQMGREINFMNGRVAQEGYEWDIDKTLKEYFDLMERPSRN